MEMRLRSGGRFRFFLVGWAVLETTLFGGLINGWASLVFVLKEDGLYAHLCPRNESLVVTQLNGSGEPADLCKEQDLNLNLWYTIAASLRHAYGIFIGFHILKLGTRSARLTGWVTFIAGALMMAFADDENPWLVLPALITLTYGGITMLLTNVQISCLFPGFTGVVVTLVSGGFDLCAATQLAMKMLHEYGVIGRRYFFLGLACLHGVMVLISTLVFMPKDMNTLEAVEKGSLQVEVEVAPSPKPRRTRAGSDSMYDWSEINVHSDHHGCTVCEDSSSYGEQKEQLATIRESETESLSQRDLPKEDQNGNQRVCKHELTSIGLDLLHSHTETNRFSASNFSHVQNISPGLCASNIDMLLTSHDDMKPSFHSQNGINGRRSTASLFTITQESGEGQGITRRDGQGKFSIDIRVGSPLSLPCRGAAGEASQQVQGAEGADSADVRGSQGSVCEVHRPQDTASRGQLERRPRHNGSAGGVNGPEADLTESSPKPTTGNAGDDDDDDEEGVTGKRMHKAGEKESEKEGEGEQQQQEMYGTLRSCLRSVVYWLHVLWFCFNVFRLVAFFGFINAKLTTMFQGSRDKVSFYTNVQAYFILSIMAVCWISGALHDWQTSIFKGRKSAFQRRALPCALPLALTSLVGVAMSVCWMAETEAALYAMFALMVFYNAFIFGIGMSFLFSVFPSRYFGILYGLQSIITGIFCFLQYAVFIWYDSYPDGPFHAEVFMLILVVASLAHPVYIVCRATLWVTPSTPTTLHHKPVTTQK